MLSIAAPHCSSWNTWWLDYGNTPEGFAELQAGIPRHLERSACMLVQFPGEAVERAPAALPVAPERAAEHIRELGEAGAEEVILVASPIEERTIRALGEVVR
jgi:hypothetical protein